MAGRSGQQCAHTGDDENYLLITLRPQAYWFVFFYSTLAAAVLSLGVILLGWNFIFQVILHACVGSFYRLGM